MADRKAQHHIVDEADWNVDEAGVVQIDPSLGIHDIGAALVAGVGPGDHIRRDRRPPRWWWQRRVWFRRREVDALERIAIALEEVCNRAK